MVIDTHQHNWQIGRFPYSWIGSEGILAQDYMPTDGLAVMQPSGVTQCVLVEGGAGAQSELPWLLELAAQYDHIPGVVGSIDNLNDTEQVLATVNPAHRQWLKGVRVNCNSECWTGFEAGFRALAANNLTCDFLVNADIVRQLPEFVAQNPDVTFILDHFAGAAIKPGGAADWTDNLRPLAALPNVVMKLSGYLTAADPKPLTAQTLTEYVEAALELFGAQRLMYGSDWPVCTLGGPYAETVNLLQQATATLSADEQHHIWSATASQTYNLTI